MANEHNALLANHTWVLVPQSPDHNIVGCKWVYKVKRHADGTLERYKARLVAKGFHQEEGIDYFETYSPVVCPTTVRIVLTIALTRGWSFCQLDVQNAFFHGDLQETVYMQQPPGFIDPDRPDHVCRLNKAIYGLKQSPRAWFNVLSKALLGQGFQASRYDPSLFILSSKGTMLVVLIYVDDIIVTGSSVEAILALIHSLQKQFPIKDFGKLNYFFGIEVKSVPNGLHLSQSKYLKDVLTRANMLNSNPLPSPMIPKTSLSKFDGDPFHDPHLYRSTVGALQYATLTRPDIAFRSTKYPNLCTPLLPLIGQRSSAYSATLRVPSHMVLPCNRHLLFPSMPTRTPIGPVLPMIASQLPVFVYSSALIFSHGIPRNNLRLLGLVPKRNTSPLLSLVPRLFGYSTSWPNCFSPTLPPTLWCDNIGATFLASNPMINSRTKHVEIDFHFVRERVANKSLSIRFLSSKDQIADIFTKPLAAPCFLHLTSKLIVSEYSSACEGRNKTTEGT